jgi:peptidoglycan/LPS O-acetylase OafA/YrhL
MHQSSETLGPGASPRLPGTDNDTPQAYRPALDGIRAIGVLSVVAYHLQMPWMRGGFLGVDLFFVLSGYLITGLLVAEHAASGRISLPRFWTRRARRLFPALLLMIVAVALGVRMLRPVTEWSAKLADLVWTLLYGANWHQIAMSQDYFAHFGSASPLRHMWSIAIEEQFYVVWPPIVAAMLTARARRWFLPAIVVAMAASAAVMIGVYDPASPTRAYAGTDTRAQALLAGAALAVMMHLRLTRASLAARAGVWMGVPCAAGLGLALIALSDASPLYYRGGALAVAIAAAVVILSVEKSPRGMMARALSWRPLAWVGRISYGLYLWHWPAILFTPTLLVMLFGGRGLAIVEHRAGLDAIVVAVTLLCTVVSYYFVEQPIRHGVRAKAMTPPNVALVTLSAACVVFLAVNVVLDVPANLLMQVKRADITCTAPVCDVVDGGPGRPVIALLGDSVARSLQPAFAHVAREHAWTFLSGAHDGCGVVQRWVALGHWKFCYDLVPGVRRAILSRKPDVIVMSDNWLSVDSFDDAGTRLVRDSPAHVADLERRMGPLVEELTSTGALLVLMHLTTEARGIECDDAAFAATPQCQAYPSGPRFSQYNAMLDRVAQRYPGRVRVIDLSDVLCPGNQCTSKVDGIIVRLDALHFSAEGARWMAPHLERKLAEAGVRFDL